MITKKTEWCHGEMTCDCGDIVSHQDYLDLLAEIERLRATAEIRYHERTVAETNLLNSLRTDLAKAEAERARISAESLARAKEDGERVKALLAQIDALREHAARGKRNG